MSIPENNDQTTDTRNPPIAFSYATEQRDQHLGIQNEVYPLQMTLPIRGPRPKPVEQKKSTPRNSPGEEEELGLSDPTWQIIECQCCFLAMPDKLAVQCPEDPTHLFCMDCLALHANQQIQHRRGYIRCLSISATQWHPCTARFRLSDLEDYLEGDILQELMELEKQGLADEEDNDTPGSVVR
ncbi:hypothetical protein KEM54_006432 [Ascosphaera aggregata]|nr:hypothetical protein KEM54_006432 [Ascosphaera aggregata]